MKGERRECFWCSVGDVIAMLLIIAFVLGFWAAVGWWVSFAV